MRTHMGTTINDFPLEVIEIVCLHLWSTDLAQVSSVCHQWHQAVGTKPFRNVDFPTERSLIRFINFLEGSLFPYGSLVDRIHFNMVHVFIAGTFVINIHELLNFCPNVQFISSNKVLSTTILQSLSSLPPGTELSRLKAIPVVDYGVVYSLCVKKFSRTLMGIDLRSVMSDNKRAILDQEFPNLKKLALGSVDSPLDLINLVLTKSNHLEYLSFDLISPRLGTPLSATDKYPSLLELKIQFKIAHNVDYVGLNTLLFRFVNLEKLTVSIFDAISDNPPSDQLYAFRDFLAWANTVPNTKMCIKNFRHENLLTYLKYVCNTIPSDKEGWKTKVAFLRSSHYSGPIISYSTHTGYRERTLAITLDDYFARNLICNYLKKLQMPFTIWIQ